MSAKDYSLFNYKDQSIFGWNSENHLMDRQDSNSHAHNLLTRPDITQQTIKSMQNWELKECGYCKAIGLDYHGHTKFECRRLAALAPCNICGASGFNNHTASQKEPHIRIPRDQFSNAEKNFIEKRQKKVEAFFERPSLIEQPNRSYTLFVHCPKRKKVKLQRLLLFDVNKLDMTDDKEITPQMVLDSHKN